MAQLTRNNSRVDKESGAIIFNGSPELQEIQKLHKKMDTLTEKIDRILALLEGGNSNGGKMENK